MSAPVQLSDLPVANLALSNDPTAATLMRVGLTDYQVAVGIIRNININAFAALPNGTPLQTDLLMVNRDVSGVRTNFQVTFGQVGFPQGTKMWFYNALPPAPNWVVEPNTGDALLACQDSTTTYAGNVTPGNQAGNWQQDGHALTVQEMPSHLHAVYGDTGTGGTVYRQGTFRAGDLHDGGINPNRFTLSAATGGLGSSTDASTNPPTYDIQATALHNHGNTWRPLANVGVIGRKAF